MPLPKSRLPGSIILNIRKGVKLKSLLKILCINFYFKIILIHFRYYIQLTTILIKLGETYASKPEEIANTAPMHKTNTEYRKNC